MADGFEPPPIRSTIGLSNGQIATIWAKWFQLLYSKVGGPSAPSIIEINNTVVTQSAELSAAQQAISELQVESAFVPCSNSKLRSRIDEIAIENAFSAPRRIINNIVQYEL